MTEKLDQATGVVTIAVAGVTAVLTPADATAWGETLLGLAPLALILFLAWRVKAMDAQLRACRAAHERVSEQLLLAFAAIKDPKVAKRLPDAMEVLEGKYNLGQCLDGDCHPKQ